MTSEWIKLEHILQNMKKKNLFPIVICTEGKPGVSDVFYFHTGSATLSTAIQFTLSMYNVVSYLEWKLSKNSFWIDFKPFIFLFPLLVKIEWKNMSDNSRWK